jgi:hypothetical protein
MTTFFLTLLSTISLIGLGSIFSESRLARLVLGLGISSLFVTPLLYINVILIRPIQLAIFAIGLLIYLKKFTDRLTLSRIRKSNSNRYLKTICTLGAYTVVVYLFMSQFSSKNYVYESHDVLYLGWLQEVWLRDYSGALRVPTMWPEAMGVANNLPGVAISQTAVLHPTMNLEIAIQVKFALLLITMVMALKPSKDFNLIKLFSFVGGLSLCLILFSGEIGSSLLLSSFWYVIILFTLLAGLFHLFLIDDRTIILLLILLIAAKSQLILIPLLVMFLMYKWDSSKFKDWKIGLFFLGLILNIVVWITGPKSSGGDLGFPTFLDIRPRKLDGGWQIDFSGILRSNDLLVGWYSGFELSLITSVTKSNPQIWIVILLLITKIYLPYYFLRKRVRMDSRHLMLMDVYMITSLFSWLFIRNGGHAGHQAHAFLLAPLVTTIFILFWITNNARKALLYGSIGVMALPVNFMLGNIPFAKELSNTKTQAISSVRNTESQMSNDLDPMAKKQVLFSIFGKRLRYIPEADYTGSQVANFTVGR